MGSFVPEDWVWEDAPPDFWEPVKRPQDFSDDTRNSPGSLLVPGSFIEDLEWYESPARSSPEFSDDTNVVIAVMGATGAGKSTFIKTVSGRNDVIIGDSLSSETQEVCAYEFFHKDTSYILVDTPGFDDTNRKDADITEKILTWLRTSLLEGTRLNGVIYLHRIADPRMGGTALRNNRMFRKLCGEDAFKNVILATTFWELVTPAVGANREKELCSNPDFWGGMLEKGAKTARLTRSRESGLALLEQISANGKVVLDAQDEMVNQGHAVNDTSLLREETEALENMQRMLAAEKQAARLKMEADAERAMVEAAAKLAMEQEILRKEAEEECMIEERRLQREWMDAQERYEKQCEEARKESQRQEERRRREKAEMERKEREEMERQRKREEEAAAEVVRQRQEYQRNYACVGHYPKWPCDNCKGRVQKYQHYYHCHFCDTDRYFHCGQCGNNCGEVTHPYMVRMESADCIVM